MYGNSCLGHWLLRNERTFLSVYITLELVSIGLIFQLWMPFNKENTLLFPVPKISCTFPYYLRGLFGTEFAHQLYWAKMNCLHFCNTDS